MDYQLISVIFPRNNVTVVQQTVDIAFSNGGLRNIFIFIQIDHTYFK